ASSRAEVSDPVERRILNLKMSMDRAFRVSSDLIRSGVPATAIKTTVYGDTRPAGPMDSKDGEAASRRVDILTGP
ncbi:MAG: OmpA family protein, partial [Alphaproteobacteria bacterium]|nr:OmpA family protein [Alphaproteobacteria bacterium]